MRVASLAVAAVSLVRCSGQARLATDDILRLGSQPPLARLPYGAAPSQYAELRLPEGQGPFPVIAVIHGGCWVQYATAQYTAHLATALVKEGWATWNVEYRGAHEDGGGWPGTFLDAGRALDALRDAARKYPLDLARVVAMGHSAGGQLALWAAARGRLPGASELHTADPLPLRGVVSLAGIADLKAYADGGPAGCVEGELLVMGGTPAQQPARYAAASPIELLPLRVPQVLVWGDEDSIVPERLFESYEKRAKQAGDSVEIVRVKNAGHHELCSAEGPGWTQITGAVRRLLR